MLYIVTTTHYINYISKQYVFFLFVVCAYNISFLFFKALISKKERREKNIKVDIVNCKYDKLSNKDLFTINCFICNSKKNIKG